MGNLLTRNTISSAELNESNVSDIVVFEKQQQVKKDSNTPNTSTQMKTGLFKSAFFGQLDPRSPSTFIVRTPIQLFRTGSSSKFNHQELLNESLNESVDIDILTAEEEESLNRNKDLVDANNKESKDEAINDEKNDSENDGKLPDPRSPTTEIARTPILANENKTEDSNLIKKITDKLLAAKISSDDNNEGLKKTTEATKKKASKTDKNLIFEDENFNDRFSTPPKKVNSQSGNERTPLSCLGNKARNTQPRTLMTSTPKGSKIPVLRERASETRIPRFFKN